MSALTAPCHDKDKFYLAAMLIAFVLNLNVIYLVQDFCLFLSCMDGVIFSLCKIINLQSAMLTQSHALCAFDNCFSLFGNRGTQQVIGTKIVELIGIHDDVLWAEE